MAPKRKRTTSLQPKGLSAGEQLKRDALPGPSSSSPWAWVGTEVTDAANITLEHRLATCNLSWKNNNAFCSNKYSTNETSSSKPTVPLSNANGELSEDIIIISDDDEISCTKKGCKTNPNCLNYLGQNAWEDEDDAQEEFFKAAKLGRDPSQHSREIDLPVGLKVVIILSSLAINKSIFKNLGATCYANASLQVWYRDLAFRSGVYSCEPPDSITEEKYKESPIFQLQVTFAALQEGNKIVFNPKSLVESLQLRTSEQQDAQEFSKLFMSHLDAEFKKQSSASTKTLITDQFQGTQVYGTICYACKNRSERASDFLEIEISFESNSKLEDRLAASLIPETLSGDNKYFCSRCETLQDATRYTELRQLPPVLHFSLLRFVYDINTMERKKSKHSISFPRVLDMNKFVGSKNDRERATTKDRADNLYELRGILLHKGASAYHGHYEAQVHDIETGSWFQFNDETVTEIKTLGDKLPVKKSTNAPNENNDENDEKPNPSQVRKNRINARKRRRIDDSDDEVIEVKRKSSTGASPRPVDKSNLIASKDAYMLIYAKKGITKDFNQVLPVAPTSPNPPPRAMEVVRDLNVSHDEACETYEARQKAREHFQELRREVRHIYLNWAVTQYTDSAIVSRQALEAWLSEHCIEAALQQNGSTEIPDDSVSTNGDPTTIPISDILCEHGALDPMKSKDMKRIPLHTVDLILKETNCMFDPLLKPADVCVDCVSSIFKEKLYEIDHPKLAKKFEEIYLCPEDDLGYWISKKWLRDWKLNKPRMHTASEADPAPDSPDYDSHVLCEHGGLSLNMTSRRKISVEAVELLQQLFPSWQPLSSDTETCAVCDAEVHISKEDKREARKRVEDEKARLKFIYEPSLDSWANGPEMVSCAVLPSQFIKKWKRWLNNPCDNLRPDLVDNTPFLCEHDLLGFDPNCAADLDSTITIIQEDQWNTLQTLYEGGPLIALTKRPKEDGGGYVHDISICADCRMKRKIEWETADIVIHLSRPEGSKRVKSSSQQRPATYARSNGARQSKRLRQYKDHNEQRRFTVTKSTTVKDLKIMANEEFSIPTICQRLFYQGQELDDNAATVGSLQLLANDVVYLREAEEIHEIHDSDSEEGPLSKRRREEGLGFGGTLLGNVDSSWSSSPEPPPSSSLPIAEKPCLACTFSNAPQALSCEMCDTLFK
ncbi:hypothetical protein BDZ97DRAFT_1956803 [Flammula alnicola]|nr:hypothetical protein BDZ97DRAFT_1956803 [Flammula alnicola]